MTKRLRGGILKTNHIYTEVVLLNNHTCYTGPPKILPREKSDKQDGILWGRVEWREGGEENVTFLEEGGDEEGEWGERGIEVMCREEEFFKELREASVCCAEAMAV
jgi:hypothetical protein